MTWTSLGRLAAVTVCGAAGLLLAIAQTFLVHDRVAAVHPAWPSVIKWSMASGFELAIISVGLACVVTGFDRWLVASEAMLLIPSLAVAVDVVRPGMLPGWVSVAAISAMPVQYLVVILAGHRLYSHYGQPAPEPDIVATPPEPAKRPAPRTRRPRVTDRLATMPDVRPAILGRDVRTALAMLDAGHPLSDVAVAVGRSERTVRRWRAGGA